MTQATETQAVETTTEATVTETPKAPSKKSRAEAIFASALAQRAAGVYTTNKAFRNAVLTSIQTELGVTVASAATMYNAAMKAAVAADPTVALGRDPKKEKVRVNAGKRGRPQGSKNRPKTVEAVATPAETTVVVDTPATEQVADPV